MMNKKLLCALIIMTLLIGVGMLSSLGADKQESQFLIESAGASEDANLKISLNTELPAQVDTVRYEVVQKIIDDKTAKALAEQFGMSENIVPPEDDESLKAADDSKKLKLRLYPEGSITYHDFSKLWTLPKTVINLPEKCDAIDIATDYLTEKGLLPEDAHIKMVVSDQLSRKNTSTGKIVENIDTNLQVIFRRELNGVPVTGPGSKLKVYIGDGGEVIGLHKVWRKLEASGTTEIKSSKSAFEGLKQGNWGSLPPRYDTVTISKVYLAYYEEGPGVEQDYLEPVWVFEGQASNGDETIEIEFMVSATIGQKQVIEET